MQEFTEALQGRRRQDAFRTNRKDRKRCIILKVLQTTN